MTYHNIISLSDAEASFLTTLAASGKQIFVTKDGYDLLGKSKATRDALARLVNKGWLERIEKGKYLIVPLEAGPDRTWDRGRHVIAGHLVSPAMVSTGPPSTTGTSPSRSPHHLCADDRPKGEPQAAGPRDAVPDRSREAAEVLR